MVRRIFALVFVLAFLGTVGSDQALAQLSQDEEIRNLIEKSEEEEADSTYPKAHLLVPCPGLETVSLHEMSIQKNVLIFYLSTGSFRQSPCRWYGGGFN